MTRHEFINRVIGESIRRVWPLPGGLLPKQTNKQTKPWLGDVGVSVCSFALCVVLLCVVLLCWRAVRNLYPPNRSWLHPSPRPNPMRHTRHGGTPFGGWGCVGVGASVRPKMRARPSSWGVRQGEEGCASRRGLSCVMRFSSSPKPPRATRIQPEPIRTVTLGVIQVEPEQQSSRLNLICAAIREQDCHPVGLDWHVVMKRQKNQVPTIDWQVRGLWYARGLCLCPCTITPMGLLPSRHRRRCIVFRVLFQQTSKQTNPSVRCSALRHQEVVQCPEVADYVH